MYIYMYAPTVCMSICTYIYIAHAIYIYIYIYGQCIQTLQQALCYTPTPKSQCFKGDFVGLIPSSIGALKKTKLTLNFGGQGVVLDATGCNTLSIYARSLSLSMSLSLSLPPRLDIRIYIYIIYIYVCIDAK